MARIAENAMGVKVVITYFCPIANFRRPKPKFYARSVNVYIVREESAFGEDKMTNKLESEIIRVLMLKNSVIKSKIGIPCRDFCNGFPFGFEIKKSVGVYYKN